jgi:hypothetical protein
MYALERNGWKYADRDKRSEKIQHLEYDYLAPDSINEIVSAIHLFIKSAGQSWFKKTTTATDICEEEIIAKGRQLLEDDDPILMEMEILAAGIENTKRKVVLVKVARAYHLFKELISFYAVNQVIHLIDKNGNATYDNIISSLPPIQKIFAWTNVGGQLIPKDEIDKLRKEIHSNNITSWDQIHLFYSKQQQAYPQQKLAHALAAYAQIFFENIGQQDKESFKNLLEAAVRTKEWMTEGIYKSREKDYTNPFRKMAYDNLEEMDAVIGKLEENSFILQQRKEFSAYKVRIKEISDYL